MSLKTIFVDHKRGWMLIIIISLIAFIVGVGVGYSQGLYVCIEAADYLLDIELDSYAMTQIAAAYPSYIDKIFKQPEVNISLDDTKV